MTMSTPEQRLRDLRGLASSVSWGGWGGMLYIGVIYSRDNGKEHGNYYYVVVNYIGGYIG